MKACMFLCFHVYNLHETQTHACFHVFSPFSTILHKLTQSQAHLAVLMLLQIKDEKWISIRKSYTVRRDPKLYTSY